MNSVILAVALAGLFFGSIYTLFKPRWAILFVVILYPLEQLLTTVSSFFVTHGKFLNLLVGGLAVVGAAAAFMGGKRPFKCYLNPVSILTALLYLWALIGVGYTPDMQKGTDDLVRALPYLGLFLVFPGLLINDLSDFRKLITPMLIFGALIVVLILTSPSTAMHGGRLGIESVAGAENEIQNPLATATLGGTIAIIAVLHKPGQHILFGNLARLAALGAGLAIAMLSGSRGQLLGACGISLLMFPFARQIKNLVQFVTVSVAGFVVVSVGFAVLSLVTTSDAAGRWDQAALDSGVGTRWLMIKTLLDAYLSSPLHLLQGLGTSSFLTYWGHEQPPYIHNMPAQVLTENGLIGVAILGLLMLFVVKSAVGLLKMCRDYPDDLATAAILVGVCLYQLVLSFKQGNYAISGAPFWWFMVLSKIYYRTHHEVVEAQLAYSYEMAYAEPELSGAV
ncbi:MAG: O-antigen ligase family protein [Phycisphaeraceae bacterium]|nr:MAG: O-antigen ligase family protein [Phycisphaeraceae bacterium]